MMNQKRGIATSYDDMIQRILDEDDALEAARASSGHDTSGSAAHQIM